VAHLLGGAQVPVRRRKVVTLDVQVKLTIGHCMLHAQQDCKQGQPVSASMLDTEHEAKQVVEVEKAKVEHHGLGNQG